MPLNYLADEEQELLPSLDDVRTGDADSMPSPWRRVGERAPAKWWERGRAAGGGLPAAPVSPVEPDRLDEESDDLGGIPESAVRPAAAVDPLETATKRVTAARDRRTKEVAAKPVAPHPKWWQRLGAAAVGGLAGYTNASGRTHVDPTGAVGAIMGAPQQQRRLSDWLDRVAAADADVAASEADLNTALKVSGANSEGALKGAQAKLANQQATTLAEEGKRKPKDRYITQPGGGVFDAEKGEWVREPVDRNQVIELSPDWVREKAPYLKPDGEGRYTIPASAAGSLIRTESGSGHAATESVPQQIGARTLAQKRGLKLDENRPLIPQLPVELQAEAERMAGQLSQKPPDELTQALKQMTLDQKRSEQEDARAPLSDDHVSTTMNGVRYVNPSGFTGKSLERLRSQAQKAGIPVVTKDEADALSQIDLAKMNLNYIEQQIMAKLPKDAAGRVTGGLGNKLSSYLQSDAVLGASGSYRTAGIQLMRAAAGSKGLRINKAEIEASMNNDLPQITDTADVALQRLRNMRAQLDNGEKAILVRDRSTLANGGATALPKGNGAQIDKATAKRFYEAAGGDPVKARKLATDNGWRVQ